MDMDDEAVPDIREALRAISPELRAAMIESLRDYAADPDDDAKYFVDGLDARGFKCTCTDDDMTGCPLTIIIDVYGEAIPEDGSGTESEIALAAVKIVEECT